MDKSEWFAVRTVIRHRSPRVYEERITLWQAGDFEEAARLAETESQEYAAALGDVEPLSLSQAYQLSDPPGPGKEVFSLMRESSLPPEQYVSTFFDTGTERQGSL
jgi:hypothetical protein